MKSTEAYLEPFAGTIEKQADVAGRKIALEQAKKAGLGVSSEGKIISCVGNPAVVLLRLIKFFTEGNNLEALAACSPLISEIEDIQNLFEIPEDARIRI